MSAIQPGADLLSLPLETMAKLLLGSLAVTNAYQAALVPRTNAAAAVSMSAIQPGDVGTTRPLGVWDPLGLMTKMPDKYRRWQEMEFKHNAERNNGRAAMMGIYGMMIHEGLTGNPIW